jgi:hypothetical protein
MLLAAYAALVVNDARAKAARRLNPERGSVTLEQAVIASALFVAAIALLAVIVKVVSEKASLIN